MSRTKLQSLSPEQEAQLASFRNDWISVGLSTEPANRPRAESACREAYTAAGLEPPSILIWLDSPLAGSVAASMVSNAEACKVLLGKSTAQVGAQVGAQVRAQVGAQVGAQVWTKVRAQVWAQVGAQVWAQVGAQVRAQVGAQVWAQVRAQVRAQVGAQVGAQVWTKVGAQVWAQVWDQVGDQVRRCGYGSHDANWIGFYRFFDSVVGLECCKRLDGIRGITESCGWWWPFDGLCILTERPNRLFRDERNRLHCEDGLSIGYPDGWGVYAWHGVRVPSEIILHPELITAEKIEKEENAELRRVMVERMGYDRYILESGIALVHSDETGALYRKEFPDDEPLVVVHVTNSTRFDNVKRTHPDRVKGTHPLVNGL